MAENVNVLVAGPNTLTPFAADEIGGVKYLRVKPAFGADGAAADVSASDPLPVTFAGAPLPATGRVVDENGTTLTVKRAKANVAASQTESSVVAASQTESSVVAAVTGKKLRVLAVASVCGGTATDITFLSNGTAISALFAQGANSGVVLGFNPHGWFETTAGEALKVTTGAGSTSGIQVTYCEV